MIFYNYMRNTCADIEIDDQIQLSEDLEFYHQFDGRIIIYNTYTKKTYSITEKDFVFLQQLKKSCSLQELYLLFPKSSKDAIARTILHFYHLNFVQLAHSDGSCYERFTEKPVSIFRRGICLFKPIRFFENKSKLLESLYYMLWGSTPILFLLSIILLKQISIFSLHSFALIDYLWIIITFFASLLFHEFSHAVVALKKGAYPTEVGVKLSKIYIPYAYTSIVGIKNVQASKDRIIIFAAGMMFHTLALSVSIISYSILNWSIFQSVALVNYASIILNALILPGTDGTAILLEMFHKSKYYISTRTDSKSNSEWKVTEKMLFSLCASASYIFTFYYLIRPLWNWSIP